MQYRTVKDGAAVSVLGFGCMRLPQKGGRIDLEESGREIRAAIGQGVNYFDTAYLYPGNEEALGTILEESGCREKIYLATKLPQYLVRKRADFERYFSEELTRLKTDHVDFYLLHMLADVGRWNKLRECGVEEWIAEKKASGAIRRIGFSFHGDTDTFLPLVDAYDWDFCQIQYNYLDEHLQAGRRGLRYAAEKGLPVIIMEPLRGGRLVQFMPQSAREIMEDYTPRYTPAQWALRWLWDQPEVTCVLSGMNSMDMLAENIDTACQCRAGALTEADLAMIRRVKDEINRTLRVGCTGCGYCMPCPRGVDIPAAFACYNRMYTERRNRARLDYMMATSYKKDDSDFSRCVGCGKCREHCPQHIDIPLALQTAGRELTPWYFRAARAVVRRVVI